jgi:hypothetical protein
MSDFIPVREQTPVALPDEKPVVDERVGIEPDDPNKLSIRHNLCKELGEAAVVERVGTNIPEDVRERFGYVVGELVSNADRPDNDRHLTHYWLWARKGELEVGIGDDVSDFVDDEREKDPLEKHGFGSVYLATLADAVLFSVIQRPSSPEGLAEQSSQKDQDEDPTLKVVRAKFRVPRLENPPESQAA